MMKKLIIITVVTVCICACGNKVEKKIENNHRPQYVTEVVKPKLEKSVGQITFTGKVESNPESSTLYTPLINGVIEQCYFSLGQFVEKGKPMLEIRSTELSALQSEIIAMESECRVALREVENGEILYKDRLLSETEYLQRKNQLTQAEAALNKAKADMKLYATQKGNDTFTVNAPITGYVISKRGTAIGSTFNEGEPLFAIADLSNVWVIANVYAGNLRFVNEGMSANITSMAYPDDVFNGKINSISHVFDPDDRTLKARITLPNPEMKLKPEMPVMITLQTGNDDLKLTIPSDAIIFDSNNHYIITQNENGYECKKVKIASQYNGKSYMADGVSENDNIVTKNHLLVYNELKGK